MSKLFTAVLNLSELPSGGKKVVRVEGRPVLLINYKDTLYAVSNICSHQHMMLHPGRVRHCKITCPVHGARFDLATGEALDLPATRPIETYAVRVVDGVIEIAA